MHSRSRILLTLALLPSLGIGCISVNQNASKGAEGGVFKSPDRGVTWVHKAALPTVQGVQSIGAVDASLFAFDPQDPKAVYLGTRGSGFFWSTDSGETWQRPGGITAGHVTALAVDPKDKCTIYASVGPRIFKSNDCNRTFITIYTDPRPEAQITTLVVDWFHSNQLLLGTATGEVSRSLDGGMSWSLVNRFEDAVGDIVMSAGDSRKIWVALRSSGIQLTENGGGTWVDLRTTTDEFSSSRSFYAIEEDRTSPGRLVLASRFGLLASTDSGRSWQSLNLLTPPESVVITALALNPKDGNDIYYATASKLYRSRDGGMSWSTQDLPTTRAASALAVDPMNADILYLGVARVK